MDWRKTEFSNLNILSSLYKLSSAHKLNKNLQILFDLTKRSLLTLHYVRTKALSAQATEKAEVLRENL